MKKLFTTLFIVLSLLLNISACTNEEANAKTSLQNEVETQAIQVAETPKTVEKPKVSVSEAAKNADLSILIMGDSLAAGYGITLESSWVALLESDLEKDGQAVEITNGSISGETTGGGLARLDELLIRSEPDIVIVELGGNDGLRGYPVKSIRKNLETIINKSRSVGANVLLCGIMIPPNYGERYANAFAELYPKLSEDLSVPLVPFILDGVALNDEMMQNDGIHPNELGQPGIKENVVRSLQPMINAIQDISGQSQKVLDTDIFKLKNPVSNIYSSGQPTADQFKQLSKSGIKHIINLRQAGEIDWDEAGHVEALGMSYTHFPISGGTGITANNAQTLTDLIASLNGEPVVIHCGSGNRVGALIALQEGLESNDIENAIATGKAWGLTRLEGTVRESLSGDK